MSIWVLSLDPMQAPQVLCQLPVQASQLPTACELQRLMQIQTVRWAEPAACLSRGSPGMLLLCDPRSAVKQMHTSGMPAIMLSLVRLCPASM